jgi:hypothetical protein
VRKNVGLAGFAEDLELEWEGRLGLLEDQEQLLDYTTFAAVTQAISVCYWVMSRVEGPDMRVRAGLEAEAGPEAHEVEVAREVGR